jgi:hypothetical protein
MTPPRRCGMANTLQSRCGTEPLGAFGNVVPDGYRYYEKRVAPREDFVHRACYLKWYDIWPADAAISPEQSAEARAFLRDEIDSRRLQLDSELGFVCLHQCRGVLLLIVVTWRNTNEMFESVYVKDLQGNGGYKTLDFATKHRGTYCVWELGPVWHERNAWVRFLKSARDVEAKRAYVGDRFSGSL